MISKQTLSVDSFVFDPPSDSGNPSALKVAAKRYSPSSSTAESRDGLILIFIHGVGFHKETWEPTIETLFSTRNRIREAWALDWQSHGDGALVNADALDKRKDGVMTPEYASGVAAFVKMHRFPRHRTICIGHSAGCATAMLSTKFFDVNDPPYAALIMVESHLVEKDNWMKRTEWREVQYPRLIEAVKIQRATWKSKESALEWFKQRPPYNKWDPRILDVYVEHALYDQAPNKVAVKCRRDQEAAAYDDAENSFVAISHFGTMSKAGTLPAHFIFGTQIDFVPPWIQNKIFNPAEGRVPASVTKVPGTGHYIVQEKPDELAVAISDILSGLSPLPQLSARL